jgi:hypothetical protein
MSRKTEKRRRTAHGGSRKKRSDKRRTHGGSRRRTEKRTEHRTEHYRYGPPVNDVTHYYKIEPTSMKRRGDKIYDW